MIQRPARVGRPFSCPPDRHTEFAGPVRAACTPRSRRMARTPARLAALGLAAAGLGLSPLPALAQSSVQLYGIIDNGISYTNNVASSVGAKGASRVGLATGFGSGDRFGLTGSEDLGDGTKAIFTLENGFSGINGTLGQGGRMFGRQAFAGLSNPRWGTLTFGRQYEFGFVYLSPFESWTQFGSIYGAHVGDVDNTFSTFRLNQSVKYEYSPMAGLTLGALYAFSNQSANSGSSGFANNRALGFGIQFQRGPLAAAASFLHLSNPSASAATSTNPGGAIGDEYTLSTSLFYNSGFVSRQDVIGVAGSYRFGNARVSAVLTDTRLRYQNGQDLRVDNYEINTRYQFTPAIMAGIGYIFTDASGYTGAGATSFASGTRARWHQIDAGAAYYFSKRTDLHASVIYQRAAGDATVAAINAFGPAGAGVRNQVAVLAGLRHRF
ncbi:porin [Pandoraea sp. CB10b_02]|uniref:porin n=1 Tax=Pandoraea sp. CB10b_02 TaxID=2014535 RepID=UPI00257C0DF2|nr:porin [Pandoraea sp. CB10b_02]